MKYKVPVITRTIVRQWPYYKWTVYEGTKVLTDGLCFRYVNAVFKSDAVMKASQNYWASWITNYQKRIDEK